VSGLRIVKALSKAGFHLDAKSNFFLQNRQEETGKGARFGRWRAGRDAPNFLSESLSKLV